MANGTFYIDSEYRCFPVMASGLREIVSDIFDGREGDIPNYRFIPAGEVWERYDGVSFYGKMLAPFSSIDPATRAELEAALAEIEEAANG